MNPLVGHVAPHLVAVTDIIAVAGGADWTRLHVRTTTPGHADPTLRFDSDTRRIHVQRSPDGPGQVPWADVAAFIRLGVTPEVVSDLRDAYRTWCDSSGRMVCGVWTLGNSGDHAAANARMTQGRQAVIACAVGRWQPSAQLDLFTPTAMTTVAVR